MSVASKTRAGLKVRVLDEATRQRRLKRQLDSLEKDNYQDDPHAAFAHLIAKTKLPAFSDGSESKWAPGFMHVNMSLWQLPHLEF